MTAFIELREEIVVPDEHPHTDEGELIEFLEAKGAKDGLFIDSQKEKIIAELKRFFTKKTRMLWAVVELRTKGKDVFQELVYADPPDIPPFPKVKCLNATPKEDVVSACTRHLEADALRRGEILNLAQRAKARKRVK